jgi:hypothetical protein
VHYTQEHKQEVACKGVGTLRSELRLKWQVLHDWHLHSMGGHGEAHVRKAISRIAIWSGSRSRVPLGIFGRRCTCDGDAHAR